MEFLASPPVPDDLKAAAARKVRRLGPELAQAVIDEWVYRFYAGLIERSALGYLDALVERAHQGSFEPKYAGIIAEARRAERGLT